MSKKNRSHATLFYNLFFCNQNVILRGMYITYDHISHNIQIYVMNHKRSCQLSHYTENDADKWYHIMADISITPYLCNESRFEIGQMVDGGEISMLKTSSHKKAMRRSLQSQHKTEDKTYNIKRNTYTIIMTGMGLAYAISDDVIVLQFCELSTNPTNEMACISKTEEFQYGNLQFLVLWVFPKRFNAATHLRFLEICRNLMTPVIHRTDETCFSLSTFFM